MLTYSIIFLKISQPRIIISTCITFHYYSHWDSKFVVHYFTCFLEFYQKGSVKCLLYIVYGAHQSLIV